MAQIGARMPLVATRTETVSGDTTSVAYENQAAIGSMTAITVTPNVQQVELYGDDRLAESYYNADTINLSLGTTTVPNNCEGIMFGATVGAEDTTTTGMSKQNVKFTGSESGYTGFGYIITEVVNGINDYVVRFFPKVKWQRASETSNTKGATLAFSTPTITGVAQYDEVYGGTDESFHFKATDKTKNKDAADAAVLKLKTLLGYTEPTPTPDPEDE